MVADGADFGSVLAHYNVAAVGTLPNAIAVATEDYLVFDVFEQLAVALFVVLLNGSHHIKLGSDGCETFFASYARKLGVHVGPLIVFAGSSIGQVVGGGRNFAIVQNLEPNLGVLFLVVCGFFKKRSYLYG